MISSKRLSLRERFPAEIAYVDSNWDRLVKDYPDKSLVIKGNDVVQVFDTIADLVEAWAEDEELRQSFICGTEKAPPFCPPRPGIVPRA